MNYTKKRFYYKRERSVSFLQFSLLISRKTSYIFPPFVSTKALNEVFSGKIRPKEENEANNPTLFIVCPSFTRSVHVSHNF